MINRIHLKNFRSIMEQNIELTPLTVIVGANNSGKSNLIKSIEFISDVATHGIQESVRKNRGLGGIIPKSYLDKEVAKQNCTINIEFLLEPHPTNVKKQMKCNYDISFAIDKRDKFKVKILSEKSTFNEFLWLSSLSEDNKKIFTAPSTITINVSDIKDFDSKPKMNSKNIDHFLNWILPYDIIVKGTVGKLKFSDKKNFFIFALYSLLNPKISVLNISSKIDLEKIKKIDKEYDTIFTSTLPKLCNHIGVTRTQLTRVSRYDFLLDKLRSEQISSMPKILDKHGSNLPSTLKMISKKDSDAWHRILDTLSLISPMISNVYTKKLASTGKEYFEFEEIFKGRNIESWESSDGALRILSVLLALECQEEYSTVLLEEPEVGLHPWGIEHLISHIRRLIEKKNIQVIITTHSDVILENVNRDEVLICSRSKEKGTEFKKIKEILPGSEKNMTDIGRKWRKGLLGGVPECV